MENKPKKTIGLCVISTGKYDQFLEPLFDSVNTHFFPGDSIIIYLFGDKPIYQFKLPSRVSVVVIPTPHAPWPASTLFRYKYFARTSNKLKMCDYLFYCDADMRMVGDVTDEILSDIIVTRHPGFWNNPEWGSQGVNGASTAFLQDNEKERYVAGGFNGGAADKFIEMCRVLAKNIDADYAIGYVAPHNDETHLNCFVNKIVKRDYPEWKVKDLTPAYCMLPNIEAREKFGLNGFDPIIYALDKNHEWLRSDSEPIGFGM